jgi:hypothetical protein
MGVGRQFGPPTGGLVRWMDTTGMKLMTGTRDHHRYLMELIQVVLGRHQCEHSERTGVVGGWVVHPKPWPREAEGSESVLRGEQRTEQGSGRHNHVVQARMYRARMVYRPPHPRGNKRYQRVFRSAVKLARRLSEAVDEDALGRERAPQCLC